MQHHLRINWKYWNRISIGLTSNNFISKVVNPRKPVVGENICWFSFYRVKSRVGQLAALACNFCKNIADIWKIILKYSGFQHVDILDHMFVSQSIILIDFESFSKWNRNNDLSISCWNVLIKSYKYSRSIDERDQSASSSEMENLHIYICVALCIGVCLSVSILSQCIYFEDSKFEPFIYSIF